MIPIALVTCRSFPQLFKDDQLLLKPLQSVGFDPHPVVWNDLKVDWKQFETIIIRSCWDYHEHLDEFNKWLETINTLKIQVWNPISILKSNIDKWVQLKQLEKSGIPIIPTFLLHKNIQQPLSKIMGKNNWYTAVVKPRFGGSGINIFKTNLSNVDKHQQQFDTLIKNGDVLIQPFKREIMDGEYSFVFIGGIYSHCILKKPKTGGFLTQGGTWNTINPPHNFIDQAKKIYKTIKAPLLYGRVDTINIGGELMVVELELCDPVLSFSYYPQSIGAFVSEINKLSS
jgi:glutathione synthase/RimK-type ligase-like ATP-grasp enzyme